MIAKQPKRKTVSDQLNAKFDVGKSKGAKLFKRRHFEQKQGIAEESKSLKRQQEQQTAEKNRKEAKTYNLF